MTETEVFELVSEGGATDLTLVVDVCRRHGAFCLIGGLAVNCYVTPVYTMDADIVVSSAALHEIGDELEQEQFAVSDFPHSLNVTMRGSKLMVQFTKDVRYQDFPARAQPMNVLGSEMPVAALPDLLRGKIWAWEDPKRRLSKRKKDELDLIRIGEAYPEMRSLLPTAIRQQIEESL